MHVLAVGQLTGKDIVPNLEEETKVVMASGSRQSKCNGG